MSRERKIIIIASPNSDGKTIFERQFLPQEADCDAFINADLIAAGLSRIYLPLVDGRMLYDTSGALPVLLDGAENK